MAADPIVIDDGGSTRIKRLKNANSLGEMDNLLTVLDDVGDPKPGQPGSHDVTAARGTKYGEKVVVTFIDSAGQATTPLSVEDFSSVTVESDKYQVIAIPVTNTGGAAQGLQITVTGPNAPIVEAKQYNRQRRYIVTNTAAITKVTVKRGAESQDFDVAAQGSRVLYTCVVIT